MHKPWDRKMKRLFLEAPHDLIEWLLPGAILLGSAPTELSGEPINADYLYYVLLQDVRCILHVEFQRNRDAKMAERIWEYNVRATIANQCPAWSAVIYLKKSSAVAEPYYTQILPGGRTPHRFEFEVIKLWDIPTEELKAQGLKGLLPLLILTREGARREVVEEAIEGLSPPGEEQKGELLALVYGFASLVFGNEEDQDWLIWRFSMLEDILSETRAFKELERKGLEKGMKKGMEQGIKKGMKQGMEKGIEKGIEKGMEKGIEKGFEKALEAQRQAQRQTIYEIIQERFPEIVSLAREQVEAISDVDQLLRLTVKVSIAQTTSEAEYNLRTVTRKDDRN